MGEKLALLGGPKAVTRDAGEATRWPIITEEDEAAVLEVLRSGDMSGTGVTKVFEQEFGAYFGMPHCLAHCNGTAALLSAMFACGIGVGDEIICPSVTYWASALPVYQLGGTVVFADCDLDTLNIDPADIERHISNRTKAIVVVHYCGYPCEMDEIMVIARRHGLKVIEDVSHAQGSLYQGRLTGTIGDVAAMSLMSGKSLVAGEAGMLVTRDRGIWERAVAFGHYERHGDLTDPDLVRYKGFAFGGVKHRLMQLASALGRVQLRHYTARIEAIQSAMNYFWDLLEGCPGVKAHRPPKGSGSTMGGWYAAKGLYRAEELGGLDIDRFCEAVSAEGCSIGAGANTAMHLHPLLNDADLYGHGKPTRIANSARDLRQPPGSLPRSEKLGRAVFRIPHFKHLYKDVIEEHAAAIRKVAERADEL
ncbi:MAG TPA: DegT/DnrJ/EryC1/StrS family aminotransferase [Candidatus Hydrogenedentes bacterium]|nr:DegT/DnrJ/EryC1/StrS family aminotransferase [Candidatus Hydrogenedentota bacterium]HPG69564.1 DegT/DnrJ/EryC1/StrS family aminotransferase [Candidatus Hydrogenedentota bacterium]